MRLENINTQIAKTAKVGKNQVIPYSVSGIIFLKGTFTFIPILFKKFGVLKKIHANAVILNTMGGVNFEGITLSTIKVITSGYMKLKAGTAIAII